MITVFRLLIATAAASYATASHATLVVQYEFNEPVGGLPTAVDSAGGATAPWAASSGASLNGAGQLVVTGATGFLGNPFTAITSGTAFLRVDFDSWGPSSDARFTFGLDASGASTGGFDGWRLQLASGDSSDGNPPGRIDEPGPFSLSGGFNRLVSNLPVDSGSSGAFPNGLSLIMGIDLTNDTTSVWWDPNRTGAYTVLDSRLDTPISNTAGSNDFDTVEGIQMQANGGPFMIDRLVVGDNFDQIAAIPEPSLVVAFGVFGVGLAAGPRREARRDG